MKARGTSPRIVSSPHLPHPTAQSSCSELAETDHICVLGARVAERFKALLALETRPPPIPLPISPFTMVWHPRMDAAPMHMWIRERITELAEQI